MVGRTYEQVRLNELLPCILLYSLLYCTRTVHITVRTFTGRWPEDSPVCGIFFCDSRRATQDTQKQIAWNVNKNSKTMVTRETTISAKEKQEKVWKHLVALSELSTTQDGRHWPSYNEVLNDVRKSDYNEVLTCPFDLHPGKAPKNHIRPRPLGFLRRKSHQTDQTKIQQQPPSLVKRIKQICPQGVVCCAKLELFPFPDNIRGRPYSGLLCPGTTVHHCLVRLSSALQPLDHRNQANRRVAQMMLGNKLANAKIFPGVGIKLFRDGTNVDSANALFLGCKVGQPEDDFFAHCLSTQITSRMPVTLKPILGIFKKYSDHPLALGISNLCFYTASGEMCEDLNFPFCLTLKPRVMGNMIDSADVAGEATEDFGDDSIGRIGSKEEKKIDSFLDSIRNIPSGTVLYDVFASPDPLSVADPMKLQRIGRIVSTSEMLDSPQDDGLFFRHQKKDEDFALRPDWRQDYLDTPVVLSDGTRGTAATLAGWELFESQIKEGCFIDFERKASS